MDIVIQGGDELYAVAKRLRGADKVIRKELLQSIRDAAKPISAAVKSNARSQLPQRGGLAALVGKSSVRVQTKTAAKTAGVRIVAQNAKNIRGMDEGRVRHPVFGGPAWVEQSIRAGWFSDPVKAASPGLRDKVSAAIERAAEQIEKG